MSTGLITLSSTELGTDVCPASPLFASTSTSVDSVDTLLSWWETTTYSSLALRLILRLFGLPVPLITSTATSVPATDNTGRDTHSLLGQVQFLRNLTRNATVNNNVITVFEGQIITIVAIVSFILVILVRDYVVQQQPDANLRAGFDDPDPVVEPAVPEPAHAPEADESSDEEENERFPTGEQVAFHERLRNRPLRHRALRANLDEDHPHALELDQGQASGSQHVEPPLNASHHELPTSPYFDGLPPMSSKSSEKDSSDVQLTPESSNPSVIDDAFEQGSSQGEDNGKAPAEPYVPDRNREIRPLYWMPPVESSSYRPRSASEGAQVQSNVNQLANNTWSFAALPKEQPTVPSQAPYDSAPMIPTPPLVPVSVPGGPSAEALGSQQSQRDQGTEDNLAPHPHASDGLQDNGQDDQVVNPPLPPTPPTPAVAVRLPSPRRVNPRGQPHNPAEWLMDKATAFMFDGIEPEIVTDDSDIEDDGQWDDIPMDDAAPAGGAHGEPAPGALGDGGLGDGVEADEPADVLDPDAIDDLEDFEGIMELLGMRGPITNLFQNVIFCALLVQIALFACVFAPFNIGRISIWIAAKPARIVRIAFELSKVVQDSLFFMGGFLSWVVFNLVDMVTGWLGGKLAQQIIAARKGSWTFFLGAGSRVVHSLALDAPLSSSGVQHWSAASHEALLTIREYAWASASAVGDVVSTLSQIKNPIAAISSLLGFAGYLWNNTRPETFAALLTPSAWVLDLGSTDKWPLNLDLAYWAPGDIAWAVFAGYLTMFLCSAAYINSGIRVSRGTALEEWENALVDSLHQASGILKVITVISIEMLVFPLYCGLLLDFAVLPLFPDATVKGRLLFTYNNPWTSVFVHWFVGTGYMFHFALFVSMCRKIMRPGVLYFIRDPDDPEFHPVRDVLERNLVTQLRKILFSAFVYGTLVVVCLGGVVWSLSWAAPTILPIQYASNDPILEFPVDLLFYNFFMPLAFKLFKPGDSLQQMYQWCFRKSARTLRLTYFLFGERHIDEEGILRLPADSPHRKAPFWQQYFLGLNGDKSKVVPSDWRSILNGVSTKGKSLDAELKILRLKKAKLENTGQIIADGRFVKAPASDRVKIPKGQQVFLEVNDRGKRKDAKPIEGLHASEQFQTVYLPPHLLTRIFLFILLIWTFAVVTGLSLTIIPLMVGRTLFKLIIPEDVHTNDIYAFCIGLHLVCPILYCISHYRKLYFRVEYWYICHRNTRARYSRMRVAAGYLANGIRLLYTYTVVFGVIPMVLATLVELYISLPAHTLRSPPTAESLGQNSGAGDSSSQHNVRVVELWTLGLLYMKISTKLVKSFMGTTRFATAMRSIFRRGWLHPEVRILTRAFVVPGLIASGFAILAPPLSVYLYELIGGAGGEDPEGHDAVRRVKMYRQAYPILLSLGLLVKYFITLGRGYKTLKNRIRDDTYLMGERLQNYDGAPSMAKSGKKVSLRRG